MTTPKRQIRFHENKAYIPLTQGYEAVIDASDAHLVEGYNWSASVRKRNCYAFRTVRLSNGKQRQILMHRAIMGAPEDMEVDHKDHDGLNNQRDNLRICTRRENLRNGQKRTCNVSGYKGVHKRKDRDKWQAQIRDGKTNKHLGYFDTAIEAYQAYCEASERIHGEFANVG